MAAFIASQQHPLPALHWSKSGSTGQSLPFIKSWDFHCFLWHCFFEWYWFILTNGLAILWQITRWHGVRGREGKPFFFFLQFSPRLGVNYGLQLMMKCWGCRNILLTQQKEQSTSLSKKQYFFCIWKPSGAQKALKLWGWCLWGGWVNEAVKLTALEAEIPKKAPLIEQWCI